MTKTPNINLNVPDYQDERWDIPVNENWNLLDAAIAGKQATLTFDTTPTSGSTNPATSGGIYTALSVKANDSDVVKLTGNQTIAGIKTFTGQEILANGFNIYDTKVTKGTNPSSTVYKSIFTINDSTYNSSGTWQSTRLAVGELSIDSTGKTDFYFGPCKNEANSWKNALIHCIYDKVNDVGYATCPTPATSDNSDKIATTAFIVNVLKALYPVGSVYLTYNSVCPLQTLGVGTWTLESTGIVTSVNTNVPIKGNGKAIGLTNGTNTFGMAAQNNIGTFVAPDIYNSNIGTAVTGYNTASNSLGVTTDASKSGIVGTVTRSVSTIKIFRRTA